MPLIPYNPNDPSMIENIFFIFSIITLLSSVNNNFSSTTCGYPLFLSFSLDNSMRLSVGAVQFLESYIDPLPSFFRYPHASHYKKHPRS